MSGPRPDVPAAFGDQVQEQLGKTLGIVAATAKELGIAIGDDLKAMLDAHSVSFSGGTISLHDEDACLNANERLERIGMEIDAGKKPSVA